MKRTTNPEIKHINLADLDVRELEYRLELATQAASCSCQATCSMHLPNPPPTTGAASSC